jgi:hypothetical protein
MCFLRRQPDIRLRLHFAHLSDESDLRDRVNAEFSDVWTRKKRKVGLPQAAISSPHPDRACARYFSGDEKRIRNPPRLLEKKFDIRPDQPCSCPFAQAYRF